MVLGEIGTIPELREVIGAPPGGIWALMGSSGKEGKGAREGALPPKPNPNWEGVGPPFLPPSLILPSSPTPTREGEESYSWWE